MPKREITRSLRWMREGTERRRSERSRRNQRFWLFSIAFLGMLFLCLPSLLCYSPAPYSWVQSFAAQYGWSIHVGRIRVGWITPLRISEIEASGPSGETLLVADSIDAPLTVLDLLSSRRNWETLNVDRLRLETTIESGKSRLEDDLEPLLQGSSSEANWQGKVIVRNASIKVNAGPSERNWRLDQMQIEAEVGTAQITGQCEAVLTDPASISGSIQVNAISPRLTDGESDTRLVLHSQGVPLSFLELLRVRFPEYAESFPEQWSGNITGTAKVNIQADQQTTLELEGLDLRNLVVLDSRITENRPWKVGQASAEGIIRFSKPEVDCQAFQVATEAGTIRLDGTLDLAALGSGNYVHCLRGEFLGELDLALLTQATPGLIPLKDDVSVRSGKVRTSVIGTEDAAGQFRSSVTLMTDPIVASVLGGRPMTIEPIAVDVVLRPSTGWFIADRFDVQSSFGTARATGNHRLGEVGFNLNLSELEQVLRNLVELPQKPLSGVASGQLRWSVAEDNRWVLEGSGQATNMSIPLFSGNILVRPRIDMRVSAEGLYSGNQLARLDRASVRVTEPGQSWEIDLESPVENPTSGSAFPLRVQGKGSLTNLATWAKPFTDTNVRTVRGEIETDLRGVFGLRGGMLQSLDLICRDLEAILAGKQLKQKILKTQFRGEARWPDNSLRADSLTLSGNAISLAARGFITPGAADFEIAYRANLEELQNSWQAVHLPTENFLPTTLHSNIDGAWHFLGDADGKLRISRENGAAGYALQIQTNAKNFQAIQPPAAIYAGSTGNRIRPTSANLRPQVAWDEPELAVDGQCVLSSDWKELQIPHLQIKNPWLTTKIAGSVISDAQATKALLQGPTTINMREVSRRLTQLLGEPILLAGVHETELRVGFDTGAKEGDKLQITGSLGWNRAEFPGVVVGPATVPVQVTETTVVISDSSIPLDTGQVNLAGEIHYRPGEMWVRQQPGRFAEGIILNPDMCRTWLKYLLPLAADATDVNGAFSVDLNECIVFPTNPALSRVIGSIQVDSAALGPGPLTRNIIGLIDQVEAAAKGFSGGSNASVEPKQWLQLDAQAIDFSLVNGFVSHQRMLAKAGRVNIISSGNVSLNGNLNLGIQIPLEATWLGNDLAFLAGQTLTLPVQGTLSQPKIDPQSVGRILGEFGAQAIQSGAENFLQKQLDRQFQKLFGN